MCEQEDNENPSADTIKPEERATLGLRPRGRGYDPGMSYLGHSLRLNRFREAERPKPGLSMHQGELFAANRLQHRYAGEGVRLQGLNPP